MAYDFFLSYRRADQSIARKLVEALEARGVSVWWDEKIAAGVDWRDAIVENLTEAHVLVILFSDECNDSKQLKKELALADDMDKDVIPVLIEDTKPKGHFLYELASRNWVQIHPNPEAKIESLADKLLGMSGKAPAHPPAAAPAPEAAPSPMDAIAPQPQPAPVEAVKTVSKTVTVHQTQSMSGSGRKTPKTKHRNFLPFKWMDIPIVAMVLFVVMLIASDGRVDRLLDNILDEPVVVGFFATCAFAIYGAFAFPVRYFMRNLRLSSAMLNYTASAVALYGIGILAIMLIVMQEGWHDDIWGVLMICAIASGILGVIAFMIYGVMHFARNMKLFQAHIEEI